MSRDQNAGQSHNINFDNSSFERVEVFKYLGTTLTDHDSIQEEIKSRLKSENNVQVLHFPSPNKYSWQTETCVEQITIGCNPTGHQYCEWQPNTKRWVDMCSSIWHWVKHTENGNTGITNLPHSGHPETTSADFNRSMRCTHPRWPNCDNYRQQSTACNWIQCHTGNDSDFGIPCCQQVPCLLTDK